MDDLIVIILTLVIAAFGALGQVRKKKQQQQAVTDNQPEDIWNFFQPEKEPITVFDENEIIGETFEEELESVKMPLYTFKPQEEGESAFKVKPDLKPMERIAPPKRKEVFSLRNAVIYSEILNRKYT